MLLDTTDEFLLSGRAEQVTAHCGSDSDIALSSCVSTKDLDAGRQSPRAGGPGYPVGVQLAAAWNDDRAWQGVTRAGGADLPGEIAGKVAIDEVVVHGWDIAVATGHAYAYDAGPLQAAHEFVQAAVARDPNGSPGLFGPPVTVPDSAPPLDRLLGLTGRNPDWRPESAD